MKQLIPTTYQPIQAKIKIPGSKSMSNRALLLAALAEGVSELSDILISDDSLALIEALRQLGVIIHLDELSAFCVMTGCKGRFPQAKASIGCASAGTVVRFLLAACSGSVGQYHLDGSLQLRSRPLASLLDILTQQGAQFTFEREKGLPLTVQGCRLKGGDVVFSSVESSQFISALLMMAPFCQTVMKISMPETTRHAYIDMTCAMMAEFGVLVKLHQACYTVPIPQSYQARHYIVEPDMSTASYFFAAAAVTAGQISMQPFSRKDSKQSDVGFLAVLEQMGCRVEASSDQFSLYGCRDLQGVTVDMQNFSDTFMTLAAIAPFATTPTTIKGIGHTQFHESNRIVSMCEGFAALGVQVEAGQDTLTIYPSTPHAAVIDSHQDHRIAMAFSVLGLRVPGVVIEGAECVTKTCPAFFSMWENLL